MDDTNALASDLEAIMAGSLTEDEFKEAQQFLDKFVLHLAPSTTERLGYAMDDRFYGINGSHLEDFRHMISQLTLADVNAAIKRHLQCENLDIVLVTKDAPSLKDALVNDAPSPITYPMPKQESVLAEDRQISTFPLKIKSDDVQIVPVTKLFAK